MSPNLNFIHLKIIILYNKRDVINDNGRMYLFGRFLFDLLDKNSYMNDMTILDTINLRIEQGNVKTQYNKQLVIKQQVACFFYNNLLTYMGLSGRHKDNPRFNA